MPIYEYRCEKCDSTFENMESINSSETEKKCPHCSGVAHRIMSPSAFHLKGSGWYNSDYKNKPKESACPAKKDAPACSGCAHAATDS